MNQFVSILGESIHPCYLGIQFPTENEFLFPILFRQSSVTTERREIGENGSCAGDSPTRTSSAGLTASSARGETQPPAAQQR